MHLRAIKLRGFKSFPDTVEVRLEPGVAVVVGPNGSGKSNVSDAIVWAAGSLSPSELRAEKPDDVLYAGGNGREPASFAEVELLFDNEDGEGPLEFSELSIARRLHRGGEGEYLVNRAHVRRTDVVELLADIGLGGEMHSIIGQGRVEQILSSKPAERRALIEEAAGLGKFKRRRHRAELKLARVQIQAERARDLEDEVRKRLRPLALQASAAERAEKLRVELEGLRGRIASAELERIEQRLSEVEERKTGAERERKSRDDTLSGLLAERHRAEEELAEAAGKHEGPLLRFTDSAALSSESSSGASGPRSPRARSGPMPRGLSLLLRHRPSRRHWRRLPAGTAPSSGTPPRRAGASSSRRPPASTQLPCSRAISSGFPPARRPRPGSNRGRTPASCSSWPTGRTRSLRSSTRLRRLPYASSRPSGPAWTRAAAAPVSSGRSSGLLARGRPSSGVLRRRRVRGFPQSRSRPPA